MAEIKGKKYKGSAKFFCISENEVKQNEGEWKKYMIN